MARIRYAKYDPQKDLQDAPRPSYILTGARYFDLIIRIKTIWFATFGEKDYEDTMMDHTTRDIARNLMKTGEDTYTDDEIYDAMMAFIDRDDWAYELAYDREREYPPEPKKARSRAGRKANRQSPGQIQMAL